jgi:hypothetical protein
LAESTADNGPKTRYRGPCFSGRGTAGGRSHLTPGVRRPRTHCGQRGGLGHRRRRGFLDRRGEAHRGARPRQRCTLRYRLGREGVAQPRNRGRLRHSRRITRVCSPRVTHHCTKMVQFAHGQDRFRSLGRSSRYFEDLPAPGGQTLPVFHDRETLVTNPGKVRSTVRRSHTGRIKELMTQRAQFVQFLEQYPQVKEQNRCIRWLSRFRAYLAAQLCRASARW